MIKECSRNGENVKLFSDIESYLRAFKDDVPPPDQRRIVELVSEIVVSGHVDKLVKENGCSLGELKDYSIEAFITERRRQLAIKFELIYRVLDVHKKRIIVDDSVQDKN